MTDEPISFTDWLTDALPISDVPDKNYRHRRLDENQELRERILPGLKQVVFDAHEDARRYIRDVEGVSLDSLEIPPGQDPAAGYPGQTVHLNNLMGYLGEILTGIICEEFAPFEEARWEVPAYLFRWHLDEDRHLDQVGQVGKNPNPDKEIRPGRQGDDCLAFIMDGAGNITHALFCESKCWTRHRKKNKKKADGSVIKVSEVIEAHQKLSDRNLIPLDRRRLIAILRDYSPDEKPKAALWVTALRRLYFEDQRASDYQRFDLVCCVYGTVQRSGETWIDRDTPNSAYKGGRHLEAIEIYIRDVKDIVRKVYEYEEPQDDSE